MNVYREIEKNSSFQPYPVMLALPVFESDGLLRLLYGRIGADLRTFVRQKSLPVTPGMSSARIVIPLRGTVVAVCDDQFLPAGPGAALILTRRHRTDCIWSAESCGLILHVPIPLLQSCVASDIDEPRRLWEINHAFSLDGPSDETGEAIAAVVAAVETQSVPSEPDADKRLVAALVRSLQAAHGNDAFPVSRSLQRALNHLKAHPDSPCTTQELASIAGVTLTTLQRNVKMCFGMTLSRLVEQVRLDWVHERLGNPMENRSVGQLAVACGFATSTAFSRCYRRRYGESPIQTRTRAYAGRRQG